MRNRLLLVLVAALLATPALAQTTRPAPETETEYAAALLDGEKIGHVVSTRTVTDETVTTTTETQITIARMGIPMTVTQKETTVETRDGKPISFMSEQNLSGLTERVEATVKDGKLRLTSAGLMGSRTETLDWPEGAVFSEGARLIQMDKGLEPGTEYTFTIFEPSMGEPTDVHVVIGEKEKVDLLGRVVLLTEVKSTMKAGMAGKITATTYVNNEAEPQKTVVPMLGMTLELLACPKEVALAKVQPVDFFDRMILQAPKPLPRNAAAVTYTLKPKPGRKLEVPATDEQTVEKGEDGVLRVTVRPIEAPSGAKLPYRGDDEAALVALKPTRYVQSDDAEVKALAQKAISDATDAAKAARRIEKFVRTHITKKNLTVGYASAAEVAESKEGDCTEHAVLVAAMCRAAGIPAQVVTGVAYVERFGGRKHIFGPHAWAQAYIGGKWVGLDAALPRSFDPGHLTLSIGGGDPTDFFDLLSTLGYFRIAGIEPVR